MQFILNIYGKINVLMTTNKIRGESMKRRIMPIFVLIALLISSVSTFANANSSFKLNDLIQTMLENNLSIKSLNNNAKITTIRIKTTEKDYEELNKSIKIMETNLLSTRNDRDQARDDYFGSPNGSIEERMAFQYYHATLHQYNALEEQYKGLIKQKTSMMKQLENMILSAKQAETKKDQEIEKLKLEMQKDYYNLVILDEQIKLMEGNLNNQKLQLSIEETKNRINMSTNLTVENIKSQIRSLELSIFEMKNNKEFAIESIKTKIGMGVEEELNILLQVPAEPYILVDINLVRLVNNFKDNNLDLETLRKNVEIQEQVIEDMKIAYKEDDDEYIMALLQLEQDKISLATTERSLEQYVKTVHFQYIKIREVISNQKENKLLAEEKFRQAGLQLKAGLISTQQYEMMQQEFNQSMFEYNKIFIDLANIRKEIELVQKGIMATAGR